MSSQQIKDLVLLVARLSNIKSKSDQSARDPVLAAELAEGVKQIIAECDAFVYNPLAQQRLIREARLVVQKHISAKAGELFKQKLSV